MKKKLKIGRKISIEKLSRHIWQCWRTHLIEWKHARSEQNNVTNVCQFMFNTYTKNFLHNSSRTPILIKTSSTCASCHSTTHFITTQNHSTFYCRHNWCNQCPDTLAISCSRQTHAQTNLSRWLAHWIEQQASNQNQSCIIQPFSWSGIKHNHRWWWPRLLCSRLLQSKLQLYSDWMRSIMVKSWSPLTLLHMQSSNPLVNHDHRHQTWSH